MEEQQTPQKNFWFALLIGTMVLVAIINFTIGGLYYNKAQKYKTLYNVEKQRLEKYGADYEVADSMERVILSEQAKESQRLVEDYKIQYDRVTKNFPGVIWCFNLKELP